MRQWHLKLQQMDINNGFAMIFNDPVDVEKLIINLNCILKSIRDNGWKKFETKVSKDKDCVVSETLFSKHSIKLS